MCRTFYHPMISRQEFKIDYAIEVLNIIDYAYFEHSSSLSKKMIEFAFSLFIIIIMGR